MVTITTVPDEGAAELLRSALELRDIPCDIVRQGSDVYLGGVTPELFAVRVAEEHAAEARQAIALLAEETPGSTSLAFRAGDPVDEVGERNESGEEGEGAAAGGGGPRERAPAADEPGGERDLENRGRPRLWIGFPVSLLVPVPVSMLYARLGNIGWAHLALGATAMLWTIVSRDRGAAMVWMVAKALDVVLAPLLVTRANRAAGGRESVRTGAALTIGMVLIAAAIGGAVWRRVSIEQQELMLARRLRDAIDDQRRGVEPLGEDGRPVQFPDSPPGRICARIVAHGHDFGRLTARLVGHYQDERAAWEALKSDQPDAAWLAARQQGAAAVRTDLEDIEILETNLDEFLVGVANYDEWTREVASRARPSRRLQQNPDEQEVRAALRDLSLAWDARCAVLGRPPVAGSEEAREEAREEDRAERSRLAQSQLALTRRAEQALRALTREP